MEIEKCDAGDMSGVSRKRAREVLQCELTASEFADALGLKSDSLFVDSMFTLADKDGNGYLSFQEFLDVIVIFMKGKMHNSWFVCISVQPSELKVSDFYIKSSELWFSSKFPKIYEGLEKSKKTAFRPIM